MGTSSHLQYHHFQKSQCDVPRIWTSMCKMEGFQPTTVPHLIPSIPLRNLTPLFSHGGNLGGSAKWHLHLGKAGMQNRVYLIADSSDRQNIFIYSGCLISSRLSKCLSTKGVWTFSLLNVDLVPFQNIYWVSATGSVLGHWGSKMIWNMGHVLRYLKCDVKDRYTSKTLFYQEH